MESESEKNSVCKGENEHDEGAGEEENNSTCEKSSISMSGSRASASTDSTDSICSSIGTYIANKPHKANDTNWQAISLVITRESSLGLQHFRIIKRLGAGDIGTVYLAQLKGTSCLYAIKVMDRDSLKSRKKLIRAHTEREILAILDHPFLPTLYTFFETEKFLCLVMEYCSGGDLHNLRQRQPKRHFSESTAKFYASEVLVAMEYLHMMGIIYRDLKPENVLVSEDGHIMLSDFDLSLRSFVSPSLVSSKNKHKSGNNGYYAQPACIEPQCITPTCVVTSCFFPRILSNKSMAKWKSKSKIKIPSGMPFKLPEFLAEPSNARSMSFVGTHEYLAPEIVKGEGHGSAVDWWTFGIFLYEMLLGKTPFKGENNHATLLNVVGQPLKFPDSPTISFAAKDLIRGLLVKEPQQRLAYAKGATEIKQHPFFEGVNWALIRSTIPPKTPKVSKTNLIRKTTAKTTVAPAINEPSTKDTNSDSLYLDFTTMF